MEAKTRKVRSDAGKTRKTRASERIATEALRKKSQQMSVGLLEQISGLSRDIVSRFRSGGNIRPASAEKLREAIQNYQPVKAKGKREVESAKEGDRCAKLILEDGTEIVLGDLDDVRAKERLICSWCYKPHEGEACKEEDLGQSQRLP